MYLCEGLNLVFGQAAIGRHDYIDFNNEVPEVHGVLEEGHTQPPHYFVLFVADDVVF